MMTKRLNVILIFVVTAVLCHHEEILLCSYSPTKKVLLIRSDSAQEPCKIYGHNFPIEAIETSLKGPLIKTVNPAEWSQAAADCFFRGQPFPPLSSSSSLSQQEPSILAVNQKQFDFIYPGTKWCGPGNVARSPDDLGPRHSTDRCCRDHDYCYDTMPSGTCKYGLCNSSPFAKSHCDCDEEFRQCLMKSTDPAGFAVGFLYFDIAAVSCYKQNGSECFAHLDDRKKREASTDWCFQPAKPFKKPAIIQQIQQFEPEESKGRRMSEKAGGGHPVSSLIHHILHTAVDVKSMVKGALLAGHGKAG